MNRISPSLARAVRETRTHLKAADATGRVQFRAGQESELKQLLGVVVAKRRAVADPEGDIYAVDALDDLEDHVRGRLATIQAKRNG